MATEQTTYHVTGMTCAHCESAVTKALNELPQVHEVTVDLPTGRVTVTTDGTPDDAAVAQAVDEAGYELAGRA
ncbi:heavy-metal-associated domain-containing protein [Streptomyces sp. NPDC005438]|uniref:heavy-metal-associated domain-containing protein n=1 Tax=Streptomyces sp. NPDC005438 TaxID=3156880 RepID=UPI0033AD5718